MTHSKISVTASSIMAFLKCPEKYKFAYIERLKKPTEPTYFWFGSKFHELLAGFYSGKDRFEIDKKIVDEINKKCSSMNSEEGELFRQQSMSMLNDISTVYVRYVDFYENDLQEWEILEVEQKIESKIYNIGMVDSMALFAKPDLIVRTNGHKWIVEHKTASSINTNYLQKITQDFQSLFYLMLVPDAVGIIYNVVSKTLQLEVGPLKGGGLSKDKNKRYNFKEYQEKIHELGLDANEYKDHIEYLKSKQGDFFYRQTVPFHEETKERFKAELAKILLEISYLELNPMASYRNLCSCYDFNNQCQYFPICSSPYPEAAKEMYVTKEAKHEQYLESDTATKAVTF